MSSISWRHLVDNVTMEAEGDLIAVWSGVGAAEASSEVDAARLAAWLMAEIPYNPDAALLKEARRLGLGAPLTTEFDFSFDERQYRGQGFAKGIVFAEVGHWNEIWSVLW